MHGKGWESVNPADIGALTEAPIITDDDRLDYVYWYPQYETKDPLEVLAEEGKVVFTREGGDNEALPESSRGRDNFGEARREKPRTGRYGRPGSKFYTQPTANIPGVGGAADGGGGGSVALADKRRGGKPRMEMAKNYRTGELTGNDKVIEDFLAGRERTSGRAANLRITRNSDEFGGGLILVNYRTPLALLQGDNLLFNTEKYSVSTTKIQNMIRRYAAEAGLRITETDDRGIMDQTEFRP